MKTFKYVLSKALPLAQMSEAEIKELWKQARSLGRGKVFVEIGTLNGGSVLVLDSVGANVYTIDRNKVELPLGTFNVIIGESTEVAQSWKLGIDLLFIDADHSFEAVEDDIKAWLPHVVPQGIILFHDYDSHRGVTLAVHEAIENKLIQPLKLSGSLLVTRKT